MQTISAASDNSSVAGKRSSTIARTGRGSATCGRRCARSTARASLTRGSAPASCARAVGAANGQNPIPIIVPCHRIVDSNGSLTGYAGGLDRKRALLALESGIPE